MTAPPTATPTGTSTPKVDVSPGGVVAMPNPAPRGPVSFAYTAAESGILHVRIWTFSGQAAAEAERPVLAGEQGILVLDLSELAAGLYFYRASVGDGGAASSVDRLVLR